MTKEQLIDIIEEMIPEIPSNSTVSEVMLYLEGFMDCQHEVIKIIEEQD